MKGFTLLENYPFLHLFILLFVIHRVHFLSALTYDIERANFVFNHKTVRIERRQLSIKQSKFGHV